MASIQDKVAGSLYGMFSGDSLAFPVHWYYDPAKLKEHKDKYYNGSMDKFYTINEEIKAQHPNSGSYPKTVMEKGGAPVQEMIKEENKPLWETPNIHWNATLKAGQNSNTTQLAKVLVDSLIANNGEYKPEDYTERYINYFKKHEYQDLYFEGIHQGYFKQLAAGKGPLEAGKEGETCLSGHTLPIPLALLLHKDREAAHKAVKDHLYLTHRSDEMVAINSHLTNLIFDLLEGNGDAKTLIAETAKKIQDNIDLAGIVAEAKEDDAPLYGKDVVSTKFSIQCYKATPGVLYLAYKHFDSPKDALIANANLGGDNTDRGSLLGAILGAAKGTEWIPTEWRDGLNDPNRPDLPGFVDKFAKLVK